MLASALPPNLLTPTRVIPTKETNRSETSRILVQEPKWEEEEMDLKAKSKWTIHLSTVGLRLWQSWSPLMNSFMLPEMVRSHELSATLITFMCLISSVHLQVSSSTSEQNKKSTYSHPSNIFRASHLCVCSGDLWGGYTWNTLFTVVLLAEIRPDTGGPLLVLLLGPQSSLWGSHVLLR
jgi:hypothetical protein